MEIKNATLEKVLFGMCFFCDKLFSPLNNLPQRKADFRIFPQKNV